MTFSNPDGWIHTYMLGEYFKMPGVYQNKMPVWENAGVTDVFLFYTPSKNWMAGPDYHKDGGWVSSKISGLTHLPLSGWQRVKGEVRRFFFVGSKFLSALN